MTDRQKGASLMAIHLIRKLEQFSSLSAEDKHALEQAAALKVRRLGPREDIVYEGEKPRHLSLILEGWACRYKTLEDGRRQIEALLIPGDLCDLRMFILKQMDHSIGTISSVTLAEIPRDTFLDLTGNSPASAAPCGGTRWSRRPSRGSGSSTTASAIRWSEWRISSASSSFGFAP